MGSCLKRDDNMTREMNDYITFTDPKFHETVCLN